MGEEIAVIAEAGKGGPTPAALELIAFARTLRQDPAAPIRVWIAGRDVEEAAARVARSADCSVTAIEGDVLEPYNAEAWMQVLAPLLAAGQHRFICLAHHADGADFAPALAARLDAACITAVESIRVAKKGPVFCRSVFNGKLRMEVAPDAQTTVLTLLPGGFGQGEAQPKSTEDHRGKDRTGLGSVPSFTGEAAGGAGMVEPGRNDRPGAFNIRRIAVPSLNLKTRVLGPLTAPEGDADLAAAEVIVAAGRGIGGEETIPLLRRLAACFSHSALGASRAACDAGFLPRRCQIGQTGMTVAPRLYIACGISGAPPHLAGMRGARCIAAINKDPGAAIFRAADIAVVEEIGAFLPLLIEACGETKN